MTAYIAYVLKFLFRIKWWLIVCPVIVALLVYLYMGRQARYYRSTTTIYTGIVSGYDLENGEGARQDWNIVNNAMDNLMNIIMSQSTLHNVSLRLYARNMVHGDAERDNSYIFARNYRSDVAHTPQEVLDLIDRTSEERTYENLKKYEVAEHGNHVYGLFHWTHRYYSYQALSRIQVRRIANSDMLEVSYENDDPGVVYNTLEILNDEFVKQYKDLRFGETNNVIAFFEAELARVGRELREQEDSLRDYSVRNLIINYDEQTKHIAILSRDFELRYEETRLNLNSSEQLRRKIENQLENLQLFRNNASFIEQLHKIGDLQSQITAAEAFTPEPSSGRQPLGTPVDVGRLQARMKLETDSLRSLTSAIASQQYTKEGIATESLIQQWLDAVLLSTKSQAEMEVVNEWKKSLDERYVQYAPVGSTLKRKNRLISFTEQSYLSMLQALNTARLRQKNLQMTSATLKIINPPVLPISAEPTKRKMMVAAAFFSTLVFLLGVFVLLELLDRTLRDKIRAERITGGKVIGAFPGPGRFAERRYVQQYREIAARFLGNAVLNYFDPSKRPNVLNVLSTEQGDGKTMMAEHLAAHLRQTGMKVRIVSWNKDFDPHQKEYLLSERLSDFVSDENEIPLGEADVVIVEYPPLSDSPVSKELLQAAELNVMVAPANRTWKDTDQLLYEKSVKMAGQTPTAIFLNCAGRDVVQTFTGLLPPRTRLRRLAYQISQFGFTAVK